MNFRPAPLVSVVVPVYNAAEFLGRTLQSVQNQHHAHVEVLIVDDGSTDNSATVAQSFVTSDPRFRLIKQKNAGVGAARNAAITQAKGEFIAPLDADDLWSPDKLQRQIECFGPGSEAVGMTYCWSVHIDENDLTMPVHKPHDVEGRRRVSAIYRNFMGNASVPLIRADVLANIGLYLTREEQGGIQGCEDWDLYIRIAERYEIRLVRKHLVGYRQLSSGMSVDSEPMARSFEIVMRRARQRNQDLPRKVFNWSENHFYTWLSRKCHKWQDYRGALRYTRRSVVSDPLQLLDPSLYRRTANAIVRSITGTRSKQPPRAATFREYSTSPFSEHPFTAPPASRQNSLFSKIQERRWARIQAMDAL